MKLLALALALVTAVPAAAPPGAIDRIIAASPAARSAFWGIKIVDLASGRTLYEQNGGHYFVPASNTKLFTTAMALTRLGPDFTFQTRVTSDQPPDADGRIAGSLRLVGGGDPNLSARAIPYKPGPITGDPLATLAELADQVVSRGVRRIEGDVIGDDTWYVWEPYADGWSVDDPRSDDGAPISALTVSDNAINLNVRPGAAAGDPATLTLNPPMEYYTILNRIRTVAAGGERHIRIERVPGSMDLRVWGTIPLGDQGEDSLLGIEDPALYAAKAFRQLLEQRGVTVGGAAVARHLYPHDLASLLQAPAPPPETGTELARHTSAPLLEDLRITDKVSENLHAELALRAVARARRNVGSFEAGREERRAFLSEVGVEPGEYNLVDGSGLSRLDLVTPSAVIKLLAYMYRSGQRANWISMLPVGGKDGTLSTRFTEGPAMGRIHAKTGSLSHVSALSGYAERPGGRWVAFAILVNNYNGPTSEIRAVMDRICAHIME
ncbi:MAG TPA: D-alanyl-D-alanine carboxypeptidase/D-alanyl-D-alanine-endopeptidase [Bryobacteraceae bacterium]|nr:D-alanyl-D-alanine carboxypeptidase/D-alanyl-D-alanine-endopeptidase [Bryobacteraceae bacterium]